MNDVSTLRLLLWRVGSARCGAPIERLVQVLPIQPVTVIPGTPKAVRGLINVRGGLITVVDCRTLLGEPDAAPGADLLLVQAGRRLIGLEVDEVEDIVTVPDGALRPRTGRDGQGPRDEGERRGSHEWEAVLEDGPPARLVDLEGLLSPLFPD